MVRGLNKDRMEKWTPTYRFINHTCIFHVGLVPQSHWIQWECVRVLVNRCEKSVCRQLVACFAAVTSQVWLATHVTFLSFLHLWHESSSRSEDMPLQQQKDRLVGDICFWPEYITNTMVDCLPASVTTVYSLTTVYFPLEEISLYSSSCSCSLYPAVDN